MLYFIGLGLCDELDITIRGQKAIQASEHVYLEAYTSILMVSVERLEKFHDKPIQLADREFIELEADKILDQAKESVVSVLVVGDPFGATTHSDLLLRARRMGIRTKVIHNASIMNAIGCTGLQLYRFGQTVSIVFFDGNWRPDSFYDKILLNKQHQFHTLCLLDIKVKEPSLENLARGKMIYEPPRYMSVPIALKQIMEIEENRACGLVSRNSIVIGLARIGCDDESIVVGTIEEFLDLYSDSSDLSPMEKLLGPPLHSLIIPGQLHCMEADILRDFAVDPESFDKYADISDR